MITRTREFDPASGVQALTGPSKGSRFSDSVSSSPPSLRLKTGKTALVVAIHLLRKSVVPSGELISSSQRGRFRDAVGHSQVDSTTITMPRKARLLKNFEVAVWIRRPLRKS